MLQQLIMKSIEDHISQKKPFESSIRRALVNVIYTGHAIADQLDQFFKEHGLTHTQYNVLRILRGASDPTSTIDIKERMLVKNADTSRIVDRLVGKGLASKCTSSDDRRKVSVSLSNGGVDLLSKIDDALHHIDDSYNHLSIKEWKLLNNLLDKLKLKN